MTQDTMDKLFNSIQKQALRNALKKEVRAGVMHEVGNVAESLARQIFKEQKPWLDKEARKTIKAEMPKALKRAIRKFLNNVSVWSES